MKPSPLYMTAFIILIIGGLNWLLVGLFGFDLIAYIFGSMSIISRILYVIVGLCAIYVIFYERVYIRQLYTRK